MFKTVKMYKSIKMMRIRAVALFVIHQAITPIDTKVRIFRTMKNQYRSILRTLKVATFLNSQYTFYEEPIFLLRKSLITTRDVK